MLYWLWACSSYWTQLCLQLLCALVIRESRLVRVPNMPHSCMPKQIIRQRNHVIVKTLHLHLVWIEHLNKKTMIVIQLITKKTKSLCVHSRQKETMVVGKETYLRSMIAWSTHKTCFRGTEQAMGEYSSFSLLSRHTFLDATVNTLSLLLSKTAVNIGCVT